MQNFGSESGEVEALNIDVNSYKNKISTAVHYFCSVHGIFIKLKFYLRSQILTLACPDGHFILFFSAVNVML